jgi:hypothetical protein
MRTTVTIDDDLLRRAKREAARTDRTLSQVLEDALRDSLAPRPAGQKRFRLRLVTAGGTGVRGGVDIADNAAVRDLMDGLG